ncbi:hypothetical protein KKI24_20500 [bacterium]|nr:hypothetical protein [bacterium]
MNIQMIMYRIKGILPLPRLLSMLTWLAAGLFCVSLGIFSAGVFENQFLKVPFQSTPFFPPVDEKADQPTTIDAFEPIITYNIFDAEVSNKELTANIESMPVTPGKDLTEIISSLQLVGISVVRGRRAVCVIRDKKNNREDIFAINDPVFDTGATVKRILSRRNESKVYLKLGRETGILTYTEEPLPKKTAAGPAPKPVTPARTDTTPLSAYTTDGKNYRITSEEVDSQLNNFAKLLNQARMVPYFNKGQHRGYQVKAIDKGSLYEKLGLKNNDVIEEINGEPLDSMEKVMGLFKKLRSEREFNIKLNRKGAPQFLNYHID